MWPPRCTTYLISNPDGEVICRCLSFLHGCSVLCCCLPGVGLLVNPRAFRTMASEVVGSITLVYLFGLIDFAAGLAIVLVHNVWTVNWRVLITLIGWLLLIRGAVRILITDTLMGYAKTVIRKKQLYPVSGGVLVILGLVLCYFGYMA